MRRSKIRRRRRTRRLSSLVQPAETRILLSGATDHQYSFEDSEVSGSTVEDVIGTADGTLANGAGVIDDAEFGKVLEVDSVTDEFVVAHSADVDVGVNDSDFSVAFWMNLQEAPDGTYRQIAKKGYLDSQRTFAMYVAQNTNQVIFSITTDTGNKSALTDTQLVQGEWTHVAYVREQNQVKLYINGQADAQTISLSEPIVVNDDDIHFGSPQANDHDAVAARYDDIQFVENHALTAAEILAIYQQRAPLVSHQYSFEDGEVSGSTVEDVIGTADGTLANGAGVIDDAEFGKVLEVDSVTDEFVVAHSADVDVGVNDSDFSVAFWMNLQEAPDGTYRQIAKKGYLDSQRTFAMCVAQNTNQVIFSITTDTGNKSALTDTQLVQGEWTHVAYVREQNQVKLYINGQADAQTISLSEPIVVNDDDIHFGSPQANDHDAVAARYDDIQLVENHALTAAEILAIYQQRASLATHQYVFDDGTGTDAIGSDDGALELGASVINDAEFGNVLDIGDVDQQFAIPHSASVDLGAGDSDFSVSFWMNLQADHDGNYRQIAKKGFGNNERTFSIWTRPHDNKLHYRISTTHDTDEGGIGNSEIALNTWTHVAYVLEGNQLTLYINGQLDSSAPLVGSVITNDDPIHFGRPQDNAHDAALARYDDIQFSDRALSSDQVLALYTSRLDRALWEFNEAPGNRDQLVNSLGSSYAHQPLTSSDSPAWVAQSSDGYSMRFTGGSDVVTVSDGLDLAAGQDRTIALWFKSISGLTELDLFSKGGTRLAPEAHWLGLYQSKPYFGMGPNTNLAIQADQTVNDDQWHHLAVSIDRSGLATMYVDGVVAGTAIDVSSLADVTFDTGDIKIGEGFRGRIDDVQVFRAALTETMIGEVMRGEHHLDELLEAHWNFDDGPGSTVVRSRVSQPFGASISEASHDGTITATTFSDDEPNAYVLQFDGVDDQLDFGRQLDINTAHRTLSFRFKGGTDVGHQPLIRNGDLGNTDQQHAISLQDGRLRLEWTENGNSNFIESATIADLSTWHDVTVTIDRAGLIALYLDGALVGQQALGISHDTNWAKPTDIAASFTVGGSATGAGGASTTFWLDDLHVCDEDFRNTHDDTQTIARGQAPELDLPPLPEIEVGQPFVYDFAAHLFDEDGNRLEAVPFTLTGTPYVELADGSVLSITDMELRNHANGSQLTWTPTAPFAEGVIHLMLHVDGCGEGGGTELPITAAVGPSTAGDANSAPVITTRPTGAEDSTASNDFQINYSLVDPGVGGLKLDGLPDAGPHSVTFNLLDHLNSPAGTPDQQLDVLFLVETGVTEGAGAAANFDTIVGDLLDQLEALQNHATFDVSVHAGVAHFGGYGGLNAQGLPIKREGDDENVSPVGTADRDRSFVLNQTVASFNETALQQALHDNLVFAGGGLTSGNERYAFYEALYQAATGAGFDGNLNGTALDDESTAPNQPDSSGDVAPYWSIGDGLGGVGFRDESLKIIIPIAREFDFLAEPSGDGVGGYAGVGTGAYSETITGAGASVLASFADANRELTAFWGETHDTTTPFGSGVTLQEAFDAVNELGALVVPVLALGDPNDLTLGSNAVQAKAIAKLTGAVDYANDEPFIGAIGQLDSLLEEVITRPVNVEVRATDDVQFTGGGPLQLDPSATTTAAFTLASFAGNPTANQFVLKLVHAGTDRLASDDFVLVSVADEYLYPAAAVDPDGDPLLYELTVSNGGTLVSSIDQTGRIRIADLSAGIYDVELKVSDLTIETDTNGDPLIGPDGTANLVLKGGVAVQNFQLVVSSNAGQNAPEFTQENGAVLADTEILTARATVGHPLSHRLYAQDVDSDPLRFALGHGAPTGMRIDAATGIVSWTPSVEDTHQTRAIDVWVFDPTGKSDRVTLQVEFEGLETFRNQTPNVLWTRPRTLYAGDLYTSTVRATDPDSDPFTFSLAGAPDGLQIGAESGELVWQLSANHVGSHTITITVTDPWGATGSLAWEVDVLSRRQPDDPWPNVNFSPDGSNGPVFDAPTAPVARRATPFSYFFRVRDPDGYAASEPELLLDSQSKSVMTLSPVPGRDEFGNITYQLTWANPQEVGRRPVTITAIDDEGDSAQHRFDIAVVDVDNLAPVIVAPPSRAVMPGQTYTAEVRYYDPDGNVLNAPIVTATIDGQPLTEVAFANDIISWTPTVEQVGQVAAVTIEVSEQGANGLKTAETFFIPVVSRTPISLLPIPDSDLAPGAEYELQPSVVDAVGTVTYGLTRADGNERPSWIDLNTSTGLVTATLPTNAAVGTLVNLVLSATDGSGRRATQEFALRVVQSSIDATVVPGSVGYVNDKGVLFIRTAGDVSGTPSVTPTGTGSVSLDPIEPRGKNLFVVPFTFTGAGTVTFDVTAGSLTDSVDVEVRDASALPPLNDADIQDEFSNFAISFIDLQVAVGSIPITITRSYDSNDRNVTGDFGKGWTLDIANVDVEVSHPDGDPDTTRGFENGSRVTFTLPGGQEETFEFQPYRKDVLFGQAITRNVAVQFNNIDPSSRATLEVVDPDNVSQDDLDLGNYLPLATEKFKLTTLAGFVYHIDPQSGRLSLIENLRDGSSLTIEAPVPGGVSEIRSSHGGNPVEVHRDGAGLITEIVDPAGQAIAYEYTGEQLDKVTARHSVVTDFDYASPTNHLLTSITVDGQDILDAVYNPDGTIASVTQPSGSNTSQKIGFAHNGFDAAKRGFTEVVNDPDGLLLSETVHDRNGNVIREIQRVDILTGGDYRFRVAVHEYDEFGRLTASYSPFLIDEDPNAASPPENQRYQINNGVLVQQSEYDDDGNLTTLTTFRQQLDQVGQPVVDGSGNPVLDPVVTRFGDFDRFGQPRMISTVLGTTYNDYDFTTGRLIRTEDAAGGVTEFVYDTPGSGVETTEVISIDEQARTFTTLSKTVTTNGYVTEVVQDPDGSATRQYFAYDDNGYQVLAYYHWTSPADGSLKTVVTRSAYDVEGRVVERRQHTLDSHLNHTLSTSAKLAIVDASAVDWTTSTDYDRLGRVRSTTDRFGTKTTNHYDRLGNVVETITDIDDAVSTVDVVARTTYDTLGRVEYTMDPHEHTDSSVPGTRTVYDDAGRVVETHRYRNVTITYTPSTELDEHGDPLYYDDPNIVNTDLLSGTQLVYDRDRLQFTIERLANSATNGLTEFDDVNFAFGVIGESVYDDTGILLESIQHLNADFVGGTLNEAAEPEKITTTFQYDSTGRQIQVTDTLGHSTRTTYDPLGRVVETTFHDGTVTKTEFNSLGQRVAEVAQHDPGDENLDLVNMTTRYRHDANGRLTQVILPPVPHPTLTGNPSVHPVYRYSYDQYGNQTTIEDNLYISEGDLAADLNADPVTVDARTTSFEYDHLHRQTQRVLPIGTASTANPNDFVEQFTYDGLGRLKTQKSFEGVTTKFEYDASGRLQFKKFFAEGNPADPHVANATGYDELFTYQYDGLGRVDTITQDHVGTARDLRTENSFDDFGRVSAVTTSLGTATGAPATPTFSIGTSALIDYDYDPISGRLQRTATDHSWELYEYDTLGRLAEVRTEAVNGGPPIPGSLVPTTRYTYDTVGNLETTFTGVVDDMDEFLVSLASYYNYDALNRLVTLDHFATVPDDGQTAGAPPRKLVSYTYDLLADGKRAGVIEHRDLITVDEGSTAQVVRDNTVTFDWEYDNLGRLVGESYATVGVITRNSTGVTLSDGYDATYEFDLVGNRLKKDVVGQGPTASSVTTYVYDDNDRLTTETVAGQTPVTYDYDDTQLITKSGPNGTTNTYNLQGRLLTSATGGTTSSYVYNDSGIRVLQDDGTTETFYLVDANNHTGFAQVREELNGNTLVRSYTIGHDKISQRDGDWDPTVPSSQSAPIHIFLYDGHGSTRALIVGDDGLPGTVVHSDAPGTEIVQYFDYDAYGNLINRHYDSGTGGLGATYTVAQAITSILYSGEQTDRNGTQYLRARYYDPATGRFNRLDPFAGNNSDPQSLHKYLYAHANPVMNVDPSGLFSITATLSSIDIGSAIRSANQSNVLRAFRAIDRVLDFVDTFRFFREVFQAVTGSPAVFSELRRLQNIANLNSGNTSRDWAKIRGLTRDHFEAVVRELLLEAPTILPRVAREHGDLLTRVGQQSVRKRIQRRPTIVIGLPSLHWPFPRIKATDAGWYSRRPEAWFCYFA